MVVVPAPPLEGMAAAPAVPLDPGATAGELGELSPADAQAAKPRDKDATTAVLVLNHRRRASIDEIIS
jgi:hypothetical protein